MDDLNGLYRDMRAFLVSPHANVEPVSPQEAQWARRMLAVGRSGRCNVCGETRIHLHPAPADG